MTELGAGRVCSLSDYDVKVCGLADFRKLLAKRRPPSGKIYLVKVCNESASNVSYVPTVQDTDFEREFGLLPFHKWNSEYLCFLDFPVFQLNAHGVCFTENGTLIQETLYPNASVAELDELVRSYDEAWEFGKPASWTFDDLGQDVLFPIFSMWSNVYFHALSECLTALHVLRLCGLQDVVAVPTPKPTTGVRNIVLGLYKGAPRNSRQPISFGRGAVLFSGLYRHAPLTPLFVEAMRNIRADVLHRDPELWASTDRDLHGKKLFVSRPEQSVRPLLNQAEVEGLAEKHGYDIVYPDRLTFEEQVLRFSTANVVIGAHGAGLANAAFAPTESLLFELRQLNRVGESPMWNSSYRKLSAAMGLRYGFEVFENEIDSDEWEIDMSKMEAIFQRLRHIAGRWQYDDGSNGFDQIYRNW